MSSANPMSEKWYEKHAWIIFLVMGIFQLIASLWVTFTGGEEEWASRFESITGTQWNALAASNPRIFNFISLVSTENGVTQLTLAILIIAISLNSYRKGEKWAWYLFGLLPVTSIVYLTVNELYGVSIVGYTAPFLVLYLLGLLLPYRKFFPKKQTKPPM